MSKKFDAVAYYQQQGFYIYPLAPGTKVPFKGSNGFNDATNNLDQLKAWWNDNPEANIGLFLKPSHLMMVDVDRHDTEIDGMANIKAIWDKFQPFPATYTEKTPRDGLHFFFRVPEGITIEQQGHAFKDILGKEKTGIDIVTHGVPVAPSNTKDGAYTVLDSRSIETIAEAPQWLIQALSKTTTASTPNRLYRAGKKYTGALLDEIVNGAASGNRNEWVMRMTSKMLAVGAELDTIYRLLLVINDNFTDDPLPLTEINATFKSRVKKETMKEG